MNTTARLADNPLEVRRAAEIVRQREIEEGLMRRHLAAAEDARLYANHNLALALSLGKATKD